MNSILAERSSLASTPKTGLHAEHDPLASQFVALGAKPARKDQTGPIEFQTSKAHFPQAKVSRHLSKNQKPDTSLASLATKQAAFILKVIKQTPKHTASPKDLSPVSGLGVAAEYWASQRALDICSGREDFKE